MNIKLSVIVPAYNVEKYIRKCLESIIEQSYRNLEIIIVDDGSTDETGKICDEYASNDERIIVIHKKNGGAVSARKAGCEVASGDYIIQVDSDDWIDKDRFEDLVRKGISEDLPDMICLSGYFQDSSDRTESIYFAEKNIGNYTAQQIFNEDLLIKDGVFMDRMFIPGLWAWGIKKDIYINNQMRLNNKIAKAQDLIVIVACLLESKNIKIIKSVTYHYLCHRVGAISYRKSDYPKESAKLFYEQIKQYMGNCKFCMNEKTIHTLAKVIYNSALLTNYKVFYDYYDKYLFPFRQVKDKSKIVVYGAGNLGVEIVNAIETDERFQLVAWIDKYSKENPRNKHKIDLPEIIPSLDFSYIVIAVLFAETSKKIKEELLHIVPEEKIVLMSTDDMSMDHLEKIFG